jgi:hypothetical protein
MILIGTDEGIYRWFEGCGWPIFHSLQDRAIVGLASPGAGLLAAIDREGEILESVNNGQTWDVIPGPEGAGGAAAKPTALAVWGEPSTIVLATQPLGLYRRVVGAPLPREATSTGGRAPALLVRARTLARGATARLAPRGRSAPASPTTVWGALGKPEVAKGKVAAAAAIRALALGDGTPPLWFVAVRGAGLWRSLDEGTTWQQCPGLPGEVLALRTIPSRPGSVVAATDDGCRISPDGGQTWEDRSAGLEKARYLGAIEVKPDEPDILLAGAASAEGMGYALYESTNGGKSWTQVKRSFPEDLHYDVITDIRYDPAAPDNVVVALGSGELWVSRNAGAYWCPLARQTRAARALCAVG